MLSANFIQLLKEARVVTLIRSLIWILKGKPIPAPNCIKHAFLKKIKQKYSPVIFVETGTFRGDTVFALKNYFDNLYTIELQDQLFVNAKDRFSGMEKIELLQGDSSVKLSEVLSKIDKKTLFWLDAHYSGHITARGDIDTPIITELKNISEHSIKNHVICIDDARLFNGKNDYPNIDEFRKLIQEEFPSHHISVDTDIICILPEN